jgi:hypothetical protein
MKYGDWSNLEINNKGIYPIDIHASTLLIIELKLLGMQLALRMFKGNLLELLEKTDVSVLPMKDYTLSRLLTWRDTQLETIKIILTNCQLSDAVTLQFIWLIKTLTNTAFFTYTSKNHKDKYHFIQMERLENSKTAITHEYQLYSQADALIYKPSNDVNIFHKTLIKDSLTDELFITRYLPLLHDRTSFSFNLMFLDISQEQSLYPFLASRLAEEKSAFIKLFPDYPIEDSWPLENKKSLAKILHLLILSENKEDTWMPWLY